MEENSYTAISRKVVGKMCTRQPRKVIWDMINYSVPNYCSCRTYFCCFPLAIANICPWPLVPFFPICLENRADKTTRNTFRDCRVHFFRQHFSKQLYVHTFQFIFFFFSLQLTLTLLAASICHFHIAALNFKCFFSSTMNLVSFLSFFFLFLFCFVFRSSSFSVIGASLVVVGGNDRTHGQVITNFFCIYRLPFFLSSERELRLYSFSITKSG